MHRVVDDVASTSTTCGGRCGEYRHTMCQVVDDVAPHDGLGPTSRRAQGELSLRQLQRPLEHRSRVVLEVEPIHIMRATSHGVIALDRRVFAIVRMTRLHMICLRP